MPEDRVQNPDLYAFYVPFESGWRGVQTRNVKWFRGGIVCKAHRLVHHSTLGWRVMHKKKEALTWDPPIESRWLGGPYRDGPASGESRILLCRIRILGYSGGGQTRSDVGTVAVSLDDCRHLRSLPGHLRRNPLVSCTATPGRETERQTDRQRQRNKRERTEREGERK